MLPVVLDGGLIADSLEINSEVLIAREDKDLALEDIDRLVDEVSNAEEAGNYKKALDLLDLILAIERRELGLDHSDLGDTLAWKGSIYKQRGLYEKAEELLRLGLEIQEKQLGVGHFDTARTLSYFGSLYQEQELYAVSYTHLTLPTICSV